MRVRVDSVEDVGVAKEARLALRFAGLVLSEPHTPADYVVQLEETERSADVVITGTDGRLERDVINRLAAARPLLVLDRRGPVNDQAITISIPPDDELRRAVSRALVEIFLTYVNHPSLPRPAAQNARTLAIAVTLDRLVQHLIDTEPTEAQLARQMARALAPPWWAFWRAR